MTRRIHGERLVWCSECYTYTKARDPLPNRCGKCGEISDKCRCFRCGHEWQPRKQVSAEYPSYCPKCKSKYFDRQPSRANAKQRRTKG